MTTETREAQPPDPSDFDPRPCDEEWHERPEAGTSCPACGREAPPAGPDLSHLKEAIQRRVAVAVTQGAVWQHGRGIPGLTTTPAWWLISPGALHPMFAMDKQQTARIAVFPYLPDWENDPAAWGALVEREGIALIPSEDGWYAIAPEDVEHGCVRGTDVPTKTVHGREQSPWPLADSPGAATMHAVLAKYGEEVPG
jgi:hypothetical protein